MMPGRREHGFLGMGGRIGRECGHGSEQRGTDELRRAFGPHVHAEIQQGGRIASGGSRHAQQVAAVGFGFHNDSSFCTCPGGFPQSVRASALECFGSVMGCVRFISTTG